MLYTIKKDGKFVKEFSEGEEFTNSKTHAEYYTNKKSAIIAAQEYGRKFGSGYTVKEIFAQSWMSR